MDCYRELFTLNSFWIDEGNLFMASVAPQVYSQHGSLLSSSPQHSLGSEGERTFNLNDSSVPTATQALMTMYRRRSPEEFNPKLVSGIALFQIHLKAFNL